MLHVIPGVAFIFNHNPSLWQIMTKYSSHSILSYFNPPYLFFHQLLFLYVLYLWVFVDYYIFNTAWSAVLLKWWQKYSVLQKLHGLMIIQLVHINLSVLPTLLGCIFGSKQGKHCVTVCSCTVMLYAPLPFFTALIQLSNWWWVCCSFWLVVYFYSTPHEAEFKLIKDILYLVVFLSSSTAAFPKSALVAWVSLSAKAFLWTKMRCQLSWVSMLQHHQLFFIHFWNYSMLSSCGVCFL